MLLLSVPFSDRTAHSHFKSSLPLDAMGKKECAVISTVLL